MQGKWIKICVAVGLVLLAVVVAEEGFSVWTVLLTVLLIACPLIVVWVAHAMRDKDRRSAADVHQAK